MTWRKVRGAKKKDVELNPEKWVEIYEKKLEIYPAEKRAFQTGMKKRFCHVLKLLPRGTPHSKVLELGPGQGWLTYFIKKWCNCEVYALDIEPLQRKHLKDEGMRVIRGDIEKEKFPFEDGFFDFVICAEVLEHLLYSPSHALYETKRVLKKGGILILTTPNARRLAVRVKSWMGKSFSRFLEKVLPPSQQHEKEYTMEELKQLLEHHGFRVKRAFYENFTSGFSVPAKFYLAATSLFKGLKEDLVIEAQAE
jgi:ubiquinone/menaquinone biosynthesis C-methylase UbiE